LRYAAPHVRKTRRRIDLNGGLGALQSQAQRAESRAQQQYIDNSAEKTPVFALPEVVTGQTA
jgi:phosphate starvation-inducible protein PhoH